MIRAGLTSHGNYPNPKELRRWSNHAAEEFPSLGNRIQPDTAMC